MGLRLKILSGFLILSMMLFAAGIWSIYELTTMGTSVQMLLDDNYKSINAAKVMIEALEREDSAVLLLLSGKWEEGRSIIDPADRLFQKGMKVAENNITIPGEKEQVQEIKATYAVYKKLWVKPIVGTRHEKNLDWYFKEVHQTFLDVKASVEKLMTMNDQTMYQTASNLKSRAHRAVMPGIVAILASLFFTVIFNYFVNYYVVNPVIRLTKGIHAFLETRTPLDMKVETKDELLELSNSVKQMMAQCRIESENR